MLTPLFSRRPLAQNLTSFVLNVSKSCTGCPLSLSSLFFWLNLITQGYCCLLPS
ncbi:hypothetical protein Hanom_Chr04g00357731 [Helianthus anomalus]